MHALLDDPDPDMRSQAMRALARLHYLKAFHKISKLVDDPTKNT